MRFVFEKGLDRAKIVRKNAGMALLVRALRGGFVWLTAVATLAVGVPHFDCICRDGTHKSFCLGLSAQPDGCCCGKSRCPSASGGKCCCRHPQNSLGEGQAKKPCCASQRQSSSDTPSARFQVKTSCCQKTPAPAEFIGVFPIEAFAKRNLSDGFSVPLPQLTLGSSVALWGQSPFLWFRYQLAPPPDLRITLQHFLI